MNKFFKGIGFYLVIFIIIVGIVQFSGKPTQKVETLEFSKVYRELTNENIILLYHKNNTIKWWHKSNGEIFFNERYKGIDLARIEQERDIPSRNVELNLWLSEDEDLYSCYEETIYFNKLNEYMTLVQII